MDPEYSDLKEAKRYIDQYYLVVDSDYGIPKKCPCGSPIIMEYTNEPILGKCYFTCKNFKDDDLHRQKYWEHGVEEEVEKLTNLVEGQSKRLKKLSHEMMKMQVEIHTLRHGDGGTGGSRRGGGSDGASKQLFS